MVTSVINRVDSMALIGPEPVKIIKSWSSSMNSGVLDIFKFKKKQKNKKKKNTRLIQVYSS